jgi:hypothetical protein
MDNGQLTTMIEQLAVLVGNLETQDNRITANPIFCVMQKRRIYGLKRSYCDDVEICTDDDGKKRKFRYVEIDEFVTACLTEQGCNDYLDRNGHNLKQPFIFVFGGWRNKEWEFLREALPVFGEHAALLAELRAAVPERSGREVSYRLAWERLQGVADILWRQDALRAGDLTTEDTKGTENEEGEVGAS